MRAYGSILAASIKRIKKVHKRTKGVSALYAFAAFVLTVLTFFPTINVQFAGKDKLFIGSFFWPIINIFKNNLNVLDIITMVLYIVMAVLVVVNFFKCITRFGKIMRRNSGNVTTCNKNLLIMEEIANAFSSAFATFLIFNLAIFMINYSAPTTSKLFGSVTLWGMAAVAVSLIVHFVCGVLGGNVSVFIIGSSIEEKKREDKIGTFFLRNLIQVVALVAILYFFVPATNLYIELGKLLVTKQPSVFTNIGGDLFAFLAVAMQAGVVVMLAILIKHATATTEYNLIGMDGAGMNNFRIFGLITAVLCVALFIFDTTDGSQINYVVAGAIALVTSVLDFIIKPRMPKQKEDDPMLRKYKEKAYLESKNPEQQGQAAQQPPMMQVPSQAANCCLYSRPCYPNGVTPEQQAEEQKAAAEGNKEGTTVNVNVKSGNVDGIPTGLPEGLPPSAPTILDVKCPSCDKHLVVKDTAPYHRCPACGKVFQIRKGQKLEMQAESEAQVDEVATAEEEAE